MSCGADGLHLHLHGDGSSNANISTDDQQFTRWKHSFPLTLLLSVIVGLLSLCTVLGNITVITSFARDQKLRKTRNYYVLNLSICDLLVGCFLTVFALINEIYEEWQLGMPFCKLWICMDQVVIYESVLSRLLIFWDRLLLTSKPLQYLAKETPKRAITKIMVTWLCSVILHCPLILLDDILPHSVSSASCSTQCTVHLLQRPTFIGLKVALAYILPFILMTGIGIQIYRNIHLKTLQYSSRQKVIRFRDVSAQTSNPDSSSTAQPPPNHVCYDKDYRPTRCSFTDYRRCTCPNRTFRDGVSQMAAVSVQYSTFPMEWWPWTEPHYQIGNYRFCRLATPWPTCRLARCTPSIPINTTKQCWTFARGKPLLLQRKFKTLIQFLSLLLAVFFICWTPYMISEIVRIICHQCIADSVVRLLYWGVYYNSTINPFIYATTLKRYSLNFYLIWCSWKAEWDKQSMYSDNTTKMWT